MGRDNCKSERVRAPAPAPAAALPTLAKGTTVPGLYSHITHSNDKDETDLPQPFKGACPKQPKSRGGGKGKQPQQKLKNPPPQTQDDQYNYEDNNKEIRTHTKANIKMTAIKAIITRVIKDFIIIHVEMFPKGIAMANREVEAMAEAEAIIAAMIMVGLIIEAMLIINIISIMVMMMSTRQTNTVHLVFYGSGYNKI